MLENLYAQSILTPNSITSGGLNSTQYANYTKVLARATHSTLHFVSVKIDTTTFNGAGTVLVSLPTILSRNFVFVLNHIKLIDAHNYNLVGSEYLPSANAGDTIRDGYSSFTLLKVDDFFVGHFTLEGKNYELFDLTGGVQLLCKVSEESLATQCGVTNQEPNSTELTTTSECDDKTIKILVLYTPNADATEPNMNAKAVMCVNDLNFIWSNSAVPYNVTLAGVVPITFWETGNIHTDLNSLAANSTAQGLRNQYGAEVVVMLTGANYYDNNTSNNSYGKAKEIGAGFNDAYCIVDIAQAASGRHTFAHEVSHLFGACHNNGSTNNTNAHEFKTGANQWGWGGIWRYTLMYGIPNGGTRIHYLSNPNVNFMNVPTGNSFHNNAEEGVKLWQDVIAQYYNDVNNPVVSVQRINCNQDYNYWHAKVEGFCPEVNEGPYTYKWYKMDFIYLFVAAFGFPIPPPVYLTSGNNQWIYMPETFQAVLLDIYNAANVLVWQGGTIAYGIDQNGNCTTFRPVNTTSVGNNNIAANHGEGLDVYPNPNNGNFSIKISGFVNDETQFNLYNVLGETMYSLTVGSIKIEDQIIPFNTVSLSPGVYFLNVKTETKNETKRIVIE